LKAAKAKEIEYPRSHVTCFS